MNLNQIRSTRIRSSKIITLIAAAKLSGCDQLLTEPIDMKADMAQATDLKLQECTSQSQLFYWPGYMIDNKGKPYDVTVQLLPTHRPSEKTIFNSEAEIPSEMRNRYRTEVQSGIDFVEFFFNSDIFFSMAKNNLFMPMAPEYEGRYGGFYGKGLGGVNVVRNGESLACCFNGCNHFDVTIVASDHGKVLFHELLHDFWFTYIDDSKRNSFSDSALAFFSLAGGTWQNDEVLGGIFRGIILDSKDPSMWKRGDPNNPKNPIDDIEEWADGLKRKGISDIQIEQIKDAVKSYIFIRTELFFIRTHNLSVPDRDNYVVVEGFTYLGTNMYNDLEEYYSKGLIPQKKMLPRFMQDAYSTALRPDKLEAFIKDSVYFSNRTDLTTFEPFLIDFINFVKQRHPWLNDIEK